MRIIGKPKKYGGAGSKKDRNIKRKRQRSLKAKRRLKANGTEDLQVFHNKKNWSSELWFLTWLEKESTIHGWERNKPLLGGRFYGDFVFDKFNLVVEIDGRSHNTEFQKSRDRIKDRDLAKSGFKVIRIRYRDNIKAKEVIKELRDIFWEARIKESA